LWFAEEAIVAKVLTIYSIDGLAAKALYLRGIIHHEGASDERIEKE
jgi:hypothetical protein